MSSSGRPSHGRHRRYPSDRAGIARILVVTQLFSPLSKLAGRPIYVLLTLKSFLLFYLMITRRTIISGSRGPIFTTFSLLESFLGAGDQSGPIFPTYQATLTN